MELNSLLLLTAVAGYGDPENGYPSAAERALVLWTNAARVAPTEFRSEYTAGDCGISDFSADERKAKSPLYLDLKLTEVARDHSIDMHDNGCFQHESCDGTDTWTRVGRKYHDENGGVGENIAYGSSDAKYTVMSMWMCSHSGHRGNIMSGDYNEMGGGIDHDFMTQDFAAGELNEGSPAVRVAAEYGEVVWADWGDDNPPAELTLHAAGQTAAMELAHGEPENGVYYQSLEAESCAPWWVSWAAESGESGTFPATGAFLTGACDAEYDASVAHDETDDAAAGSEGLELPTLLCSTTPGAGALAAAFGALAALRRRRP